MVTRARRGDNGHDGASSFKSVVFKRSNAASVDAPTGGSYTSPVPEGWSDGVPNGEEKLWMSTRIFTDSGAAPQQSVWTTPAAVTDTADIDFEFSAAATPGTPTTSSSKWHNTATPNDIWMAVRKKSNGVWGDWEVSKIKGEQGDPGKNGKTLYTWIKYADTSTGGGISDSPVNTDGSLKKYIGFAYNKETPTESSVASDYTWALFKGTDGTNGINGTNGKDGATYYTWIKYADSLGTSGYPTNMYDTPKTTTEYIGIAVNQTTQTEGTDPSKYAWSKFKGDQGAPGKDGKGILSQVDYYAVSASKTEPPTEWTANTPPNMTSTLRYLWKYTLTTFTDETTEQTTPCVVGTFGVDGLSYRYSKWVEGVEYRNDNNPYYRDSNGQGIIDVVYTEAITIYDPNTTATPPPGYICRKTHNSSEDIQLAVGEYWMQMNAQMPILSALVLADRIKANYIDVENLAANSAFIDNLTVNRLVAGIQNGQRVEITPDNKSVNIYDADGTLASTFEGNMYQNIAALFGDSSSGTIAITSASGTKRMDGAGIFSSSTPISNPIHFTTPTEITTGTGTLSIESIITRQGGSSVTLMFLSLCTYSEENCTNRIGNITLYQAAATTGTTYNHSFPVLKGLVNAGWTRLEIKIISNQTGFPAVICSWSNIANATYSSEYYVSRYFANGLCLGKKNDNYIALYRQPAGGMRALMENGVYGFDFSNYGIKFRRSTSEGWKSLIPTYGMPLGVLAMGTMNLNSTSPSMGTYKAVNGGTISVSRQSDGTFKVTVPSSWGSTYLVQLTTLGRTDSNNPMGASVYSISSGSFIVDTMSLKGTWVNEAKVMFMITKLEDFNV